MPKWGLTEGQASTEPWGIETQWLVPAKTITDPIHGDIYVTRLEAEFINSAPMQRLRRVKQLGTTHLVYPGATHTRFSHALGTMRAAQDLLDSVVDSSLGPRAENDLFSQWRRRDPSGRLYDERIAEATVLARLGALLHDFCHVPFGHTIEDDLKILHPHDRNRKRFNRLWGQFPTPLRRLISADLKRELELLILSKNAKTHENRDPQEGRYPFVVDIVGNTICADLIDYLQRDHAHLGLPMELGHRFANDFYVNREDAVHYKSRMVIRVSRGGRERADVISELLKYLRYRYELSERALYHHAKLAADSMISKLLEMWSDWLWIEAAQRDLPRLVQRHRDLDVLKSRVESAAPGSTGRYLEEVRETLEEAFTTRGDDGILEYLADWGRAAPGADSRRQAVGELAQAVLDRQLYKLIGRADSRHDRALAKKLYKENGTSDRRRQLEMGAAAAAEISDRFHVVTWIPSPKMGLKVAQVLVDDGGHIAPLTDFDGTRDKRASEVYEAHQGLWAISVFAHETLQAAAASNRDSNRRVDTVLAYLADELGIGFRRFDGSQPGSMIQVAVDSLIGARQVQPRDRDALIASAQLDIAASGARGTHREFVQRVREIARTKRLLVSQH